MARIKVEISFLPGVEDPEALTIKKNLNLLGYTDIMSVRTSKTYEFEIADSAKDPEGIVREISEKLLANPVIQSFNIKE